MTKHKFIVLIILSIALSGLSAQSNDLKSLVNSLLLTNSDYQQLLSKYNQEKSVNTINKSLSWFDMSFVYKQYDNDFTRDDRNSTLEHSRVDEKDKRWGVELSKQLFSKDFDNEQDAIGSRFDLLRYGQDLKLMKTRASSDILDDLIYWYETEQRITQLKQELSVLENQNQVLEDMNQQNQIDSDILISNIEDLDEKESELSESLKITSLFASKYGNILPSFTDKIQSYINSHPQADTLQFKANVIQEIKGLKKDVNSINNHIDMHYYSFFMPELNLKLSYNWRENRQHWNINDNSVLKKLIRNQDEEYPEGDIEFVLPFNFVSNAYGKYSLLRAYDLELDYRSRDMLYAWERFALDHTTQYQIAEKQFERRCRLNELYQHQLSLQQKRFKEEPALLGANPSLQLQKTTLKADKAQLNMRIAEMKLYKEIFLMTNMEEDVR
ncbi:MAG TPA: hypothetical protein PLE74_08430 [Candidatus Cloacimonadota bacterium]|nr:hypothetical protein [Candidatus Cloacimonadota bacterium]